MTYGLDRHRVVAHECGHAVGAHLLGRIVCAVTLEHPVIGGGASVWESTHPVVQKCPDWFTVFGRASTTAPFFPPREPS